MKNYLKFLQTNTNNEKFLAFLNHKNFKNIFDYLDSEDSFDFNTQFTDELVRDINFEIEGQMIFKNKLKIYNDQFEKMLLPYYHLQQYNGIGCCSFLSISPLFLSLDEVINFHNSINDCRDDAYALLPLISLMIDRIYSVISEELKFKIKNKVKYFYPRNSRKSMFEGIDEFLISDLLCELGLSLCVIQNFGSNITYIMLNYDQYPLFYIMRFQYFEYAHAEVCLNPNHYYCLDDYKNTFMEYSSYDDDEDLFMDAYSIYSSEEDTMDTYLYMSQRYFGLNNGRRRNFKPKVVIINKNKKIYKNKKNKNNKKKKKKVVVEPKEITIYPGSKRPIKNLNYENAVKMHNTQMVNYIKSLINPENSVNGGFVAKQPSYVPIPTSNVTFKEKIDFKCSSNGEFACIWAPNYLANQSAVDKFVPTDTQLYPFNYYSHFYYKTNGKWFAHTSIRPAIDVSKYRLVSAKMSIQYNGSNLNRSGQLSTCAIYTDIPVFMGRTTGQVEDVEMKSEDFPDIAASLDKLIDIESINNGLWNKFDNVSIQRGRIDNIALPTDPTDHTFFPLGNYYAANPTRLTSNVRMCMSTDGGHLSYVGAGKNLTASNEGLNMSVIIYYNFEIIASQETAPFLRAKVGPEETIFNFLNSNKEYILKTAAELTSNEKIIDEPTTKRLSSQIWSGLKDVILNKPKIRRKWSF